MFLRHEGFLGALGAFMSYERHSLGDLMVNQSVQIPVEASSSTDTNYNPLERDLNETESMQCSVYQAQNQLKLPFCVLWCLKEICWYHWVDLQVEEVHSQCNIVKTSQDQQFLQKDVSTCSIKVSVKKFRERCQSNACYFA